jgi:NADH:flavin oxidoreductase / NADH oxidase family
LFRKDNGPLNQKRLKKLPGSKRVADGALADSSATRPFLRWNILPLGASARLNDLHGLAAREMSVPEIHEVVELFARAAERAASAEMDGIELHSANGYWFTQFLSSAINNRTDRYGAVLKNRARFLLEVIQAIQDSVGRQFPLIVKLTGRHLHRAFGVLPLGTGRHSKTRSRLHNGASKQACTHCMFPWETPFLILTIPLASFPWTSFCGRMHR